MSFRRTRAASATKRSFSSNSKCLSYFFNTITVVSMGAVFWIISSPHISSKILSNSSNARRQPPDPSFYTPQNFGEPAWEELIFPRKDRRERYHSLPLPPTGTLYDHSSSASILSAGIDGAAAAAALSLENERLATKITKKVVPLATPQGYDSVAHTLTLATWQISGIPHEPAQDSPAIAQVKAFIKLYTD